MAEIMSRTDLFSPADNRSAPPPPLSRKRLSPSLVSFPFKSARCSSFTSDFHGRRLVCLDRRSPRSSSAHALSVQMGLQSMKWWEKGLQINMKEIESAQDLADALLNAGNRLVVVDFFSPGCGGCRSLHPKICQIAEMNPHVMFLHVNYEEHKSMCHTLNVHVLPFFRFYRGAQGRVCSFSCTNATIKKFRDALAKHTTDCCSLGPAKGLKESELMALAANKDLSFNYTRHPGQEQVHMADTVTVPSPSPTPGDTVTVPSPTPGQEQVHTPGDTVTVLSPTPGQEQVHTPDTVTVPSSTLKHPVLVGLRAAQEEALAPTGR